MTPTTTAESLSFPVTWNNPEERLATWHHDPMHFPRPVSPLFQSMWEAAFSYGFTRAARELATPIHAVHVRFHNGYEYEWHEMNEPSNEEEARALAARTESTMRDAIAKQQERWHHEYLPRLLETRSILATLEVDQASEETLQDQLDQVMEILKEDWYIHFLIALPMLLTLQLFDEFFVEVFGGDAADAHALLVGRSSKSVEAGIGLANLAGEASDLGLKERLLSLDAARAFEELQQTDVGRLFAAKLKTYLDEYGLRQDLFDFLTPTWQENPSIAMMNLQAYLQSGHDMAESHRQTAARADAAAADARERLEGYPESVRQQFEFLLEAARFGSFIQEEHNFYIDQQGLSLVRLYLMRLGRRLVAEDVIDQPEDIFMLRWEEIKEVIGGILKPRELIADRWRTLALQAQMVPPPFLGAPPSEAPPPDNPMIRAVMRFFGGPPEEATESNQLKGNAGSRGKARGPARVALTLDDARNLKPGEILVAPTTMPAWTPLFGTAVAVVTETGGALSHCAIVAREYEIPAVVGAFGATSRIRTGQMIEVDGDHGIVTIE